MSKEKVEIIIIIIVKSSFTHHLDFILSVNKIIIILVIMIIITIVIIIIVIIQIYRYCAQNRDFNFNLRILPR